ncbi:hypothetical protein Drose_18295 [Dactylosporangium roseum]|uniref:Uncharacterized protein n=1 Tax=Dactylosporangium roseum TaxID=47989 RepID=A0ABY5ZCZ8_9ACTN|nr:hypothetical protein [Dactylosporangium roseum]UWZ39980.1 hypothetical protein Drose_18295 [Dactylosporangium roseum]
MDVNHVANGVNHSWGSEQSKIDMHNNKIGADYGAMLAKHPTHFSYTETVHLVKGWVLDDGCRGACFYNYGVFR